MPSDDGVYSKKYYDQWGSHGQQPGGPIANTGGHTPTGNSDGTWGPFTNAASGVKDFVSGLGPSTSKALAPGGDWAGNMQASRGQLQGAIDPIKQWALTGNGPSAAQAQLQAGKDQSLAAASSQAKSAYGLTPGQQASLATNAGTAATQQAANQSAQLRAQEQQQAMANYLAAVNAQRQGDIDVYKAYSDQYAQTAMANAQAKNGFMGGLLQTAGGIIGL